MSVHFEKGTVVSAAQDAFADLAARIRTYGIQVLTERLSLEVPGRFDGPTITVNTTHSVREQCYHLTHAFGSIVGWSVDFAGASAVFAELRAAKRTRPRDAGRLERALVAFSRFEERASEYGVWFLLNAGHGDLVEPYTTFFRADLDAMLIFHREDRAPVWPEFFAAWTRDARRGTRQVKPYTPRPVPDFTPARIPQQDVVQEHDGEP